MPTPPTAPNNENKYRPTKWGSTQAIEDLTVPSGQLCRVRRPGIQGLMAAGLLNDLDLFSSLVSQRIEAVKSGKEEQPVDVKELTEDPKKLTNIIHLMDRVVCHVVLEPKVEMTPNDITRRKPDVIYADEVDLEDKMFIFQYAVGGSRDLESFRQEISQSVGGVATQSGLF